MPQNGKYVEVRSCGFAQPSLGVGPAALFDAMLSRAASSPSAPWSPSSYVKSSQLRRMSRVSSLAFVSGVLAARESGLFEGPAGAGEKVSAIFVSTHGATRFLRDFHEGFIEDPVQGASPMLFTNGVSNAPVAHVSMELGIRGRCHTFVNGALGAFEGLDVAHRLIASGDSAALLSAAEENCEVMDRGYAAFAAARKRATRKVLPGRSGLCEGGAALALSCPGEGGIKIGKPVFAAPGPNPADVSAQVRGAVRECLEAAGLMLEDPGFVVCSLNGGTQDETEKTGLAGAFAGRASALPVCAPSILLGEGFAFTALTQVLAGFLILDRGLVPPFPETGAELPAPLLAAGTPLPVTNPRGIVVCRDADGSVAAAEMFLAR